MNNIDGLLSLVLVFGLFLNLNISQKVKNNLIGLSVSIFGGWLYLIAADGPSSYETILFLNTIMILLLLYVLLVEKKSYKFQLLSWMSALLVVNSTNIVFLMIAMMLFLYIFFFHERKRGSDFMLYGWILLVFLFVSFTLSTQGYELFSYTVKNHRFFLVSFFILASLIFYLINHIGEKNIQASCLLNKGLLFTIIIKLCFLSNQFFRDIFYSNQLLVFYIVFIFIIINVAIRLFHLFRKFSLRELIIQNYKIFLIYFFALHIINYDASKHLQLLFVCGLIFLSYLSLHVSYNEEITSKEVIDSKLEKLNLSIIIFALLLISPGLASFASILYIPYYSGMLNLDESGPFYIVLGLQLLVSVMYFVILYKRREKVVSLTKHFVFGLKNYFLAVGGISLFVVILVMEFS